MNNLYTMDFQKDVIDRSHTLPILVDFWAEWCGPCRVLTPVLEAVGREQEGRWALVKVNTEEHRELASRYGIRSIPNVKLFHGGKVIDEFTGALTRPMLERWLDEHLPDPEAGALDLILEQATSWPDNTLIAPLEAFLFSHPERADAKVALALYSVVQAPAAAKALALEIPVGNKHQETAADVLTLVELMEFSGNGSPAAVPLEAARASLLAGAMENALQQLIAAVMTDKNFRDALPRRTAVALFRLLGEHHPLTQTYRRRFSMALS